MTWMLLGWLTIVWLGIHTLTMLNPKKTKTDKTFANVLVDHINRAEHGPTARGRRNR